MLVAGAVALLIFPVPAPVLDGLLAAQLGVAVVVLLAAVFARSPWPCPSCRPCCWSRRCCG
ncbi:MAG: hypothetical protein R3F43_25210 [bacterium]